MYSFVHVLPAPLHFRSEICKKRITIAAAIRLYFSATVAVTVAEVIPVATATKPPILRVLHLVRFWKRGFISSSEAAKSQ